MNEKYLVHYGVQGMRWGFRKKAETSGMGRQGGLITSLRSRSLERKVDRFRTKLSRGGVYATNAMRNKGFLSERDIAKRRKATEALEEKYSTRATEKQQREFWDKHRKLNKAFNSKNVKTFDSLSTKQKLSVIRNADFETGKSALQLTGLGVMTVAALSAPALIPLLHK